MIIIICCFQHMRDSLSEEIHMAFLPYNLLYIADIPSAVVAQPSSAAVVAQPSPAVGSLLYVRPLTPNDRIPVGFRHFSCLPSLRHCKDNTFFQGFIYRKSPTFPFGGSGGYTLLFLGKSLGEVSLRFSCYPSIYHLSWLSILFISKFIV